MQTEANVVRAYRELRNGFRSCEAVRLKLADEGQDISAEKIRDVIRVMAAMECKTDSIVRAANTLRRVLELGELSEVAPAARHMQDAEDILFALKPLPTEWAFRELRQALALVFAAAEHLRECNGSSIMPRRWMRCATRARRSSRGSESTTRTEPFN